ncbi:MAG: hypothetical protein KGI00_02205 [Candidatus Micrarchaeota archaeon]|nr:hypothetical protein [Candidatus Micrarchaeota archaeon]MDE1824033.1 hypothetical protein [Candidatus Micrarchaeota archaeon]MDE1849521.1 hypothetical protein [Candidatus Micrarchaeota archaeon]
MIAKAITKNQLLILSEAANNPYPITTLLRNLSRRERISISTLKSSARSLKELGMIAFGNSETARLTSAGKLLIQIVAIR